MYDKWFQSSDLFDITIFPLALDCLLSTDCSKVRTFWETHKIWKNLPHDFEKSADFLSNRQNNEEDFFKCVLLK